jgi:hypothetical protein
MLYSKRFGDKMKNLYELTIGEDTLLGEWTITRVPGGWLFLHYGGCGKTSVFVPYHNEFDDRVI